MKPRLRHFAVCVRDPFKSAEFYRDVFGFEIVGHETLKAGELRDRYLDRLAHRKDALAQLCRATGWQLGLHHTGDSAQAALLWLYRALDGGTR